MASYIDTDTLPAPPYSETVVEHNSLWRADQSQGTIMPREEFRRQAQAIRHIRGTEALRWLLLSTLKVDYDVDPGTEQRFLLTSNFALYVLESLSLYKAAFGVETCPDAVAMFLDEMPEAVQALNLGHGLLPLMLANYYEVIRASPSQIYRSQADSLPVRLAAMKLWWDRNYAIDALVPPEEPELRLRLHAALQKKQMMTFEFIQGPKDYGLTPAGKKRQKQDVQKELASKRGNLEAEPQQGYTCVIL